ncbi:MAG: hypothetical protein FWG07_08155 [Treponema sp.]|nr:hypothetical protein [Treponema sp.]
MLRKKLIFCLLCAFFCLIVYAQEEELSNTDWERSWDIDSLFDDSTTEILEEEDIVPINLRDKVLLEAVYGFVAGISPGWTEVPWNKEKREYDFILGGRMEALLSMDIPLTESLRVHNAFYFSLPDDKSIFSIKEFYFEHDFWGQAFLKAGLYETNWGISRFFPFTNLPALVPNDPNDEKNWGDAYTGRLIIPKGIGGLELLAMTRWGYMDVKSSPTIEEFAFGAKYNLAMEAADIDVGFMYHRLLPLRFFLSIKTTIGNTELYSEALAAVSHETWDNPHFSGNLGFLQDFFNGTISLVGEVFYNGESDSVWWRPRTEVLEESTVDLFKGLNAALGFVIRPGFIGMRIFSQALYTYEGKSVWLVPGISIKLGDINISVSTPMALGKRTEDGDRSNYYRNNADEHNRPFSVIVGINFSGKLRYTL